MKRLFIALFLGTLGICGVLSYYAYHYFAPPKQHKSFKMNNNQQTDTLRIAFIGDSWAFYHRKHTCLIAKYIENDLHIPVSVHSYGICGNTSKEIYQDMYDNNDFKSFLQKHPYKYCFVSAGINDTYRKLGTTYFKKSVEGIIQLLIDNHIRPIIMEIPDYNINLAYERQTLSRKVLRRFSMIINNCPLDCKQQFRDALDELIKEKGYNDTVSIIHYKSWNANGNKDLKDLYVNDGMHLNKIGYTKLDSAIAKAIIQLNDNSDF